MTGERNGGAPTAAPRGTSAFDELLPLLRRLDARLAQAAARARAAFAAPPDEWLRGLYVRSADVDSALAREPVAPLFADGGARELVAGLRRGSRLGYVAADAGLNGFDVAVVVLAVAPEIDLRYERVYGYLQDDVTKRRATVALALDLFCTDARDRLHRRARFGADAPLLRGRILSLDDGGGTSRLGSALRLDEQVLRFLVDDPTLDTRLAAFCRLSTAHAGGLAPDASGSPSDAALLAPLLDRMAMPGEAARARVRGQARDGRRLAGALASHVGRPLLAVRTALVPADASIGSLAARIAREARWRGAILHVDAPTPLAAALPRAGPATLISTTAVGVAVPGVIDITLPSAARDERERARGALTRLARPVPTPHGWRDLVLPDDAMEQLRELRGRVRHASRVLDEWGFARALTNGRGVTALFAGPSGTGKTMAAGVVARSLRLPLYRVDLARVVSKYIGETEKNLDGVFAAAERADAVLLFDEADALFGKRSEVEDAHDRYANLEISYLLQRMEQYEGVAILSTNMRGSLDEAFTRRLAFVVHFPFPDAESRRRIWQAMWPRHAPLDPGVDLDALARRFELSGGGIRNAALAAAFTAAADQGVVTTSCLLGAIRREYQKLGKLVSEVELRSGRGIGGARDAVPAWGAA